MQQLIKDQILKATVPQPWDVFNGFLYKMCKDNPAHSDEGVIIAKVCLIGRSYSVAIERGSGSDLTGDALYEKKVGKMIKEENIDDWLDGLYSLEKASDENWTDIVSVHHKLTNLFSKISGKMNRSLASKYLHFHFPKLFYIYDSRALDGIKKYTPRSSIKKLQLPNGCDKDYAKFFHRCLYLVNKIKSEYGDKLNPRQLDNLLLERKQ